MTTDYILTYIVTSDFIIRLQFLYAWYALLQYIS